MKYLKHLWGLVLSLFAFLSVASAQSTPPAEPEYTGTAFDKITETSLDGFLFLLVVMAIGIVATGYFVGRKWFRRV